MPTFLTTPRMSPELRRRIERSVSQPAGTERFARGRTPTTVAALRLLIALGVAGVLGVLAFTFAQSRREVSEKQRELTSRALRAERSLSAEARARLEKVDAWITRVVESPDAAFREEKVSLGWRGEASRRALLEAPFFYLRGDVAQLRGAEGRRAILAEASVDAFPGCLVSPPDSDKESVLLRKIGRRAPDQVVPALEAQALLDFSATRFNAEVRAAEHMHQLRDLDLRLGRERISHARGSKAATRFFLLVVDEPKAQDKPSDFDGEAPHHMRIVFLDLETGEEHLSVRRKVDPAWISDKSRLSFSRALDSCKLARELHAGP